MAGPRASKLNNRTAAAVQIQEVGHGVDLDDAIKLEHNQSSKLPNQKPLPVGGKDAPEGQTMSKKRKRRLDAYVAKKLKKEKRNELIKTLEQTQSTVKDSSAFISTANLSSASSVARTQKELKTIAATIESRRRQRAQKLIASKQKSRSGYHSQSDTDADEPDWPLNSLPGTLEISNATSQSHSQRPSFVPPKDPSAEILPKPSDPSKPALGSALAAHATTIFVKRAAKQTKPSPIPRAPEEDDSFDSSESSLDDDSCDSDSEEDEVLSMAPDENDSNSTGGDDGSEWGGCGVSDDGADEPIANPTGESQASTVSVPSLAAPRVKGSIRDWANLQLQQTEAHNLNETPSSRDTHSETVVAGTLETAPAITTKNMKSPSRCGPLGVPLDLPETPLFLHQKTVHVPLLRSDEIMASRSLLPVFAEEHTVMDAIRRHAVVVICGETGSGKTTQVPQFLYEAGWGSESGDNPGMIGVTQPRRVAAVSMARRVETEMGLVGTGIVGHQIRYETTTSPATRLKFMTDGVILRELAADFLLSKYSVIIVDEAHERSVNTDVLIGVLSRIVRLRMKMWTESLSARTSGQQPPAKECRAGSSKGKEPTNPLRLIIMSATLRVSDFTLNKTLFSEPPPVIEIGARQFPVAIHFNRRTSMDYVGEAFNKASKIHVRLPPGGILIFLTGQLEIMTLCRKLEKKFGRQAIEERKARKAALAARTSTYSKSLFPLPVKEQGDDNVAAMSKQDRHPQDSIVEEVDNDFTTGEAENVNLGKDLHELAADVDQGEAWEDPEALDTDDEDELVVEGVELAADSDVPMHILPLYSLLPTDQQMKVFEDPPPDSRLVIVATNVAETSLTIPNIRYVVDCGRAKERHYDLSSGIQSFEIDWVSKASAAQRAGRAGRTGPGHCYRLYSSAVYENYFPEFSKPEIQRMPIEGIVLQMKSMNIDTVANFPFPTPPDRQALRKAELGLAQLGALSFKKGQDDWFMKGDLAAEGSITDLGRAMAKYPLTPRFGRMLVSGFQHGCLPYVIAIVSILSVGDPFIHETAIDEENAVDSLDEHASTEIGFLSKDEVKNREIRKQKRRQYFKVQQQYASLGGGVSDLFKILAVVGAYEFGQAGNPTKFCHENFVRPKAMEEIHKLRGQITRIVQATTVGSEVKVEFSPKLMPPSELQMKLLRQLITTAFIDQVAIKATRVDSSGACVKKAASNGKQGLVPYRAIGVQEDVYIHPTSILFDSSSHPAPEFIIFQELHRTGNRVWIKGITKINPAWLPVLGKSLCSFSKPLESSATPVSADERRCFVVPKFGGPGLDVALSPVEVTQRKIGNRWVWV